MYTPSKFLWVTFSFAISIFCFWDNVHAAQNPLMRILVLEADQARFRGDRGRYFSIYGTNENLRQIRSISFAVEDGDVSYLINKNHSQWIKLPRKFNLTIKNNDPRGIWLGNRRYNGKLKVIRSQNKLQVINYIRMEDYLKSVVGSEMPKEWPMAALQAQAIAARTYALKQLNKRNDYDMKATQLSQVYLGVESITSRISKAVRDTNSLALFYDGKLINAVFHSSSGGRTEDSSSVWKYHFPYLTSVKDYDQQGPKYKWRKVFTASDLNDIFKEIGGFNGLQIISTSKTGRIVRLKIHGPKGEWSMSGKDLRSKLRMNSTLFDFYFSFNPLNEDSKAHSWLSLESKMKNPESKELYPADYSFPLPDVSSDYLLVVDGFGAGHGVGLSQWGAKQMASQGANYRTILKHYYQGAKIKSYF